MDISVTHGQLLFQTVLNRFRAASNWQLNLMANCFRLRDKTTQKIIYLARTQAEAEHEIEVMENLGIYCELVETGAKSQFWPTKALDTLEAESDPPAI